METRLVLLGSMVLLTACSATKTNWELYRESMLIDGSAPMETTTYAARAPSSTEEAATALAEGNTIIFVEAPNAERIALRPGSETSLRLEGVNLDEIDRIVVTRNGSPVSGITANFMRVHESEALVLVRAQPNVPPGSGYELRLYSGDTRAPAPVRISVIDDDRGYVRGGLRAAP